MKAQRDGLISAQSWNFCRIERQVEEENGRPAILTRVSSQFPEGVDEKNQSISFYLPENQGSWGGRGGGGGGVMVGSPGVGGTSNSSSSSGASWRSGTPSPPLSDEGAPTTGSLWPTSAHPSHNQQHYPYNASGSSSSSTPGSTTTLDEGIVPDYLEEQHPRKKKVSGSL